MHVPFWKGKKKKHFDKITAFSNSVIFQLLANTGWLVCITSFFHSLWAVSLKPCTGMADITMPFWQEANHFWQIKAYGLTKLRVFQVVANTGWQICIVSPLHSFSAVSFKNCTGVADLMKICRCLFEKKKKKKEFYSLSKLRMYKFVWSNLLTVRSGSSAVDNMLDYQYRGCKIYPPLLQSFGWLFKSRPCLRMT